MENETKGWIFAVFFFGLAVLHILLPNFNIDNVFLILILIGTFPFILPVIYPYIKSIKLGAGTIEFRDVKNSVEKILTSADPSKLDIPEKLTYDEISIIDPNLELVSLRISIEKRIRKLSEKFPNENFKGKPLSTSIRRLVNLEGINNQSAVGLLEMVSLGNSAAHGQEVSIEAGIWARENSKQILNYLDELLEK